MQTPVSELMRDCSSATVVETTRLRDAARILIQHGCTDLVVTDECGQLSGLVSEATVIRELMATTSHDVALSSIQSRHIESVREDVVLAKVLHLFRSSCHAILPVVDQSSCVVGLLHRCDIVGLLLRDQETAGNSPTQIDGGKQGNTTRRPYFMNGHNKSPSSRSKAADSDRTDGDTPTS